MRRKSSVFQPQLVTILRQGFVAPGVFFILSIARLYYNAQNLAGLSIIFFYSNKLTIKVFW